MNMKLRYRLFLRRKSVYYAFDDTTKTFTGLKTKDKPEAERLLMAMNEAGKQPAMNLSLARVYLRHSDPPVSARTWQNVLDEIIALKTGPTQARWKSAAKDKAFDLIRATVSLLRHRPSICWPCCAPAQFQPMRFCGRFITSRWT